jgi:hypothetical protein
MAEKVEIDDVSKLRPELLSKSYNELERMKAEIEMAMASKEQEERRRKRAALVEEASTRIDRVVDDLNWLHENSFMSPNVREFFGGKDRAKNDIFAPHLRLKKPTK